MDWLAFIERFRALLFNHLSQLDSLRFVRFLMSDCRGFGEPQKMVCQINATRFPTTMGHDNYIELSIACPITGVDFVGEQMLDGSDGCFALSHDLAYYTRGGE
jgi:hypothetical protein